MMKKTLKILLPILIICIVGSVYYNLTKPTKINNFIASKIYKTPANTRFTDENFYKCVVDAYNDENNTSVAYTESLNDEQLESITDLVCDSSIISIKDTTGLKLLKKLKTLTIYSEAEELTEIDVSNNPKLEYLELTAPINSIKGINNLNSLKSLFLMVNNKELEIDFTKLVSLKELYIESYVDYEFMLDNKIDLSKNINLENLSLRGYNLNNFDLSNNTKLVNLILYYNNIEEIDLGNNINLESVWLSDNKLTNIDLSKNINIKYLDLSDNQLSSIDVSNLKKLIAIGIINNKLTNIDLSNNIELKEVQIEGNNLSTLDLSNNTQLIGVRANKNPLSYSFGLYINECKKLDVDLGFLKLPSEFGLTNSLFGDIVNKDYNVCSNSVGVYQIKSNNSLTNYSDKTDRLHYLFSQENNYKGTYYVYIVETTSDRYIINNEENYIYIKNDKKDKILKNIVTNYGTSTIVNNNILIKFNDEIIKTFEIKNIDFGNLNTGNGVIGINNNINYDEFINNITVSEGLMYKIFNGETEITGGNISKGMNLKVYQGEELIDNYEITDEYLDLSLLNVDDDKKLIKDLVIGTKVSEFKDKISTTGNITVVDKDNEILTDDKLIASGSKVKIELTNETYEYTLSVRGDVTGNGQAKMADVMKIATHIIEGNVIKGEAFERAADVTGDGKIKMNDVMKLATFIIDGGEL